MNKNLLGVRLRLIAACLFGGGLAGVALAQVPTLQDYRAEDYIQKEIYLQDSVVKGRMQRCYSKLHACFRAGDVAAALQAEPTSTLDCISSCQFIDPGNVQACSASECADRCSVAFGFKDPPCE